MDAVREKFRPRSGPSHPSTNLVSADGAINRTQPTGNVSCRNVLKYSYRCVAVFSTLKRSTSSPRLCAWAPNSSLLEAICSLPAAACSVT